MLLGVICITAVKSQDSSISESGYCQKKPLMHFFLSDQGPDLSITVLKSQGCIVFRNSQ